MLKNDQTCYAVIFSARQRDLDQEGRRAYGKTAERMMTLAATMPGFLGVDHARNPDGFGITISYWESEEAITAWRDHAEHKEARHRGKAEWYSAYNLRIARVNRHYDWQLNNDE